MSCFYTWMVVFLFVVSADAAETLHAVIVCDTLDPLIGNSVKEDFAMMRSEVQKAAYYSGMPLQEYLLKEEETTPQHLSNVLRDLPISSNDAVIFFFSGHGYRTKKKDAPWPDLYFSQTGKGYASDTILEILQKKKPRFFLLALDCCNNILPEQQAPPFWKKDEVILRKNKNLERNYRKLFFDSRGQVIVSSSKPGQYSWGGSKGGIFTIAFLKVLAEKTESRRSPSWEDILVLTDLELIKYRETSFIQCSEYQIIMD